MQTLHTLKRYKKKSNKAADPLNKHDTTNDIMIHSSAFEAPCALLVLIKKVIE